MLLCLRRLSPGRVGAYGILERVIIFISFPLPQLINAAGNGYIKVPGFHVDLHDNSDEINESFLHIYNDVSRTLIL